jgi:hypothetical protein
LEDSRITKRRMPCATDIPRPRPGPIAPENNVLQPDESEMIATYLTLAGMLLLVVSPLLIPLTLTVMRFASGRFGDSPNRRKITTARPLPATVPVFGNLPGVHAAPSRA